MKIFWFCSNFENCLEL